MSPTFRQEWVGPQEQQNWINNVTSQQYDQHLPSWCTQTPEVSSMIIENGVYIGNIVHNDDLPYILLQIGHKEGSGLEVKAIKDSGATRSCMDKRFWDHIPNNNRITTIPITGSVTVADAKPLPLLFVAYPTVTFFDNQGRHFGVTQKTYIAQGLQYEFYLGNDFLAGEHKTLETPTTMLLSSQPEITSKVVLPTESHFFHIPIHNATNKQGASIKLSSLRVNEINSITAINPQRTSSAPPPPEEAQEEPMPSRFPSSNKLHVFTEPDLKIYTVEEMLADLPLSHLDEQDASKVRKIFRDNSDILAKDEFDVHHTPLLQAKIELKQDLPPIMNAKYTPINPKLAPQADKLINYYLERGILQFCNSASPFTSNLQFILKANKTIRAILDARLLNNNSKKLSMSLTSHQEIIALLANQQYISTLDVSNAFFSIALTEESAPYTAFFDHRHRRLAFKSCPQGWLNSPFF